MKLLSLGAALAAGLLTVSSAAITAEAPRLAVVELFTSQGCSSCPPADANILSLSGRPDVLALSFGVTYWDDLGWKDTFAQPQFTERQRRYEPGFGGKELSTPQVVVNGRAQTVGARKADIDRLIETTERPGSLGVKIDGATVAIAAGAAPRTPADVWLVRYDPKVAPVAIQRGENGGKTIPLKNVVHELTRLGSWTGAAASFKLPAGAAGLQTAILVQVPGGAILAAAKGPAIKTVS
jgi:hypothetical protein